MTARKHFLLCIVFIVVTIIAVLINLMESKHEQDIIRNKGRIERREAVEEKKAKVGVEQPLPFFEWKEISKKIIIHC